MNACPPETGGIIVLATCQPDQQGWELRTLPRYPLRSLGGAPM